MLIVFTEHGWNDFTYWMDNDPEIALKIKDLLKDISRNPFKGVGKPEPLRFSLKGYWSRRITGEHRLVYTVTGQKGKDQQCIILQCRFHYDK